jgi:O-glycosyl hydrolase
MPDVAPQARKARKGGANTARVVVGPGDDWAKIDRTVSALRAQGQKPLFVTGFANRYADYPGYLKQLAGRYKSAGIQIDNEPNLAGRQSAQDYGAVLKSARRALKGEKERIIAAAPAPIDDPARTGGQPWLKYLKQVRKAGPRKGVDYAVNLYPGAGTPRKAPQRILKDYKRARKAVGGKNLWVTETGVSSSTAGEKNQARSLKKVYKGLSRKGARGVFVHRLKRDPTFYPDSEWEQGMAVGKPAYKALKKARRKSLRRRR